MQKILLHHFSEKLKHLTAEDLLSINVAKRSVFFQKRGRSLSAPACTILALDSIATITIDNRIAEVEVAGEPALALAVDCPFDLLNTINREYSRHVNLDDMPANVRFAAGLIGYLGFGITSSLENIKRQNNNPLAVPDAVMIIPESIIYIDHEMNSVHIFSHSNAKLDELKKRLQSLNQSAKPARLVNPSFATSPREVFQSANLQCSMSRTQFVDRAAKAKAFIKEGQCFQIVLSQRFYTKFDGNGGDIFASLLNTAASSYNYYIDLPEFQYLGASPETMISSRSDRVRLCALAGTRSRGMSPEQDARHEEELKGNEKELAEHLMLVDLGRNDLGKVCKPGSISVGPIAQVLKYPNVMHLGTEIFGQLEAAQTPLSALRACFPRGTVSGAPKVRALELLSDLEPEQRGIYSGAVGYLDCRGDMDTAIAIRSALIKNGFAHINAGAGIVFDSNPEDEYLETMHKASSIAGILKSRNEVIAS